MRTCASEWKQAQAAGTTGGQSLASVSGAVPYAPGRSHRADGGSRAAPSVRLPIPMVAAVDADFRGCFKCRRSGDRPKRHETLREPMERRQGRWNDRRPDVATVSVAMPHAPRLHRFVLGRFRSAPPGPGARLSVRLSVPVVATIGALDRAHTERRHALDPAGGPIHDRARGACSLPVGHRRVGQHADAHLPLFGNPLLRAHPQGRIYVRG